MLSLFDSFTFSWKDSSVKNGFFAAFLFIFLYFFFFSAGLDNIFPVRIEKSILLAPVDFLLTGEIKTSVWTLFATLGQYPELLWSLLKLCFCIICCLFILYLCGQSIFLSQARCQLEKEIYHFMKRDFSISTLKISAILSPVVIGCLVWIYFSFIKLFILFLNNLYPHLPAIGYYNPFSAYYLIGASLLYTAIVLPIFFIRRRNKKKTSVVKNILTFLQLLLSMVVVIISFGALIWFVIFVLSHLQSLSCTFLLTALFLTMMITTGHGRFYFIAILPFYLMLAGYFYFSTSTASGLWALWSICAGYFMIFFFLSMMLSALSHLFIQTAYVYSTGISAKQDAIARQPENLRPIEELYDQYLKEHTKASKSNFFHRKRTK